MNILISGICGFMGREVEKLCAEGYRGARMSIGVDISADGTKECVFSSFDEVPYDAPIDCIVDFSHHSAVKKLLAFATERKIPAVVATTGHTEDELIEIKNAAKYIPVFFSANMSLGVALLVELARTAVAAMPDADIEIVEKHHNRKLDAPSGTALMLAREICEVREGAYPNPGRCGSAKREKNEIGIHAIRMGNIVGEHEVIIGTGTQTITLKHEAHSRALFAEGGLAAAEFIIDMPKGLYDMRSLIGGKEAALSK